MCQGHLGVGTSTKIIQERAATGPKQPQLSLKPSQQHRPEPRAQPYPSVTLIHLLWDRWKVECGCPHLSLHSNTTVLTGKGKTPSLLHSPISAQSTGILPGKWNVWTSGADLSFTHRRKLLGLVLRLKKSFQYKARSQNINPPPASLCLDGVWNIFT